jgi:hypothetical protein
MTVRLKFKCTKKTEVHCANPADNYFELEFNPVTGGSDENKTFWKWTPTGQIKFNTLNMDAAKEFTAGYDYYFDITGQWPTPAAMVVLSKTEIKVPVE